MTRYREMAEFERLMRDYVKNVQRLRMADKELQLLMSVHAQSYERIGGGHGGISSPVENVAARAGRLEAEITMLRNLIEPVWYLLNDLAEGTKTERRIGEVCLMRFVYGRTWRCVCRHVGIGNRRAFQLARRGLEQLKKKCGKRISVTR